LPLAAWSRMEDPVEEYSDREECADEADDAEHLVAPVTEASGGIHNSEQLPPLGDGFPFEDTVPGFEDTFPASPETVLAAVRMNGDASLGEDGLQQHQQVFVDLSTQACLQAHGGIHEQEAHAVAEGFAPEESDGGEGEEAIGEVVLPEEPWEFFPPQEREMWEKIRPRALRREAAELRAMRLPTAAVNRLMRLHPHLPMKSGEAIDIINYATVLLMQAVVRAAVREKGGGRVRVQFADIRKACVGVRELQFMHPLEHTLDASAVVMRPDHSLLAGLDGTGNDGGRAAGHAAVGGGGGGAARGVSRAVPLGVGQRTLSMGAFATASVPIPGAAAALEAEAEEAAPEDAHVAAAEGAESEGEVTPNPRETERSTVVKKRKAPASATKGPSKAPRRVEPPQKAQAAPAPAGITAFFRRAPAVANA